MAINIYHSCSSVMNNMNNISRNDLLCWVNTTLQATYTKINDLRIGSAYCQFMDLLYPGCLNLRRVKFTTNIQHEIAANIRELKNSFIKLGVDKSAELLVSGRLEDNFDFAQWFKKFFDANYLPLHESYDPVAARFGKFLGSMSQKSAKKTKSDLTSMKTRASTPSLTEKSRENSIAQKRHASTAKSVPMMVSRHMLRGIPSLTSPANVCNVNTSRFDTGQPTTDARNYYDQETALGNEYFNGSRSEQDANLHGTDYTASENMPRFNAATQGRIYEYQDQPMKASNNERDLHLRSYATPENFSGTDRRRFAESILEHMQTDAERFYKQERSIREYLRASSNERNMDPSETFTVPETRSKFNCTQSMSVDARCHNDRGRAFGTEMYDVDLKNERDLNPSRLNEPVKKNLRSTRQKEERQPVVVVEPAQKKYRTREFRELEQERDMYYTKLHDIEILCQNNVHLNLPIIHQVMDVLYAED